MRSRYTAFTLANSDDLMKSHHSETRKINDKKDIESWAKSVNWLKLDILNTTQGQASDDYGTVEVANLTQWGIPTIINDITLKSSVCSSGANAPVSLLIFINALILAVWGIIFYIVFKIFQIRKIGKVHNLNNI